MHSMPSYRVSTVGYLLASPLNLMVAPAPTLSSTLLSRWMAPLVQVPAGTMTRPPPAWFAALMAAAKAAVLAARPLLAPNAVMLNVRLGMLTCLVAATIACASGQGRSLGATLKPGPAAWGAAGALVLASASCARIGAATAAPATAAPRPIACRRDKLSAMLFHYSSWPGQRIRWRVSDGPTADLAPDLSIEARRW